MIMKLLFFIVLMFFSFNVESSDLIDRNHFVSPFKLTNKEFLEMCEHNEKECDRWIFGFLEGMEFIYLFGKDDKRNFLCIDTADISTYFDDIKKISLNSIKELPEGSKNLDQPAVFSISTGLRKYLCRHNPN